MTPYKRDDDTPTDGISLKQRARSLFNNQAHGNMGPALYTNGGGSRYSTILSTNEQYAPYQGEVALIQEHTYDVAKWAGDIDTVIIVGPGPAQAIETKELPILRHLLNLKTVKLIDLSADFNNQAKDALEQQYGESVNVETYTGDFQTVTINGNYPRALVITTGSLTNFENAPIDNFPTATAKSYMKRFQELAKSGGKIVWGYDSNNNKPALEQEYNTPEIADFILNPLYKLSAAADVTLDPAKFSYTAEFFPRGSHLAHYWTATENQNIKIDNDVLNVFKDDRFLCFSSIKLNPDRLNLLAQNQNKGIKSYTHYSKDGQVLHCFDCN